MSALAVSMASASSIPKPRSASSSPSNMRVPIGSRVVLSRRRCGFVRFVGKLKHEAGEWYGIVLDEATGEHDGSWDNVRYFDSAPNHGVFVRRKEIFNVREVSIHRTKGPPSPVHDTSDDGSTGSSGESTCTQDHSTQATDSVASSPSVASPIMTPLLRTFDTFRRELQVITGSVSNTLTSSPGRGAKDGAKPKLPERGTSRTATFSSRNSTSSLPSPTHSLESKPAASVPAAEQASETRPVESSRTQSFSIPQPSSTSKSGPTASPSKLVLMRTARVATFSSPGSVSLRPEPAAEPVSATQELSPVASWPMEEDLDLLNAVAAVAPVPVRDQDQAPAPRQEEEQAETTMVEPFDSPTSSGNAFFFRRWNVGKPLQRRASMSSTSPSHSGSSSASGSSTPSGSSVSSNARVAELERELCAMKTNHENVVAVLRATNKQHAANVLELRAQVAALTDGNNWLNKQLASKNALVQELRQMEKHDRISRADVENLLALKDTQIRTLEKEISKLKKQVQRIETEKDSILCQQVKHFRARHERDEDRIDRLREDVLSMCNERVSLQTELHDLQEMSSLWF